MFLDDTRNIAILTGFLACTDTPGVRRLFQNISTATYITVMVPEGCDVPNMAPVDLSGPIVALDGEAAVRADFIEAASERSFIGVKNFVKVGDAPQDFGRLDFMPLEGWAPSAEVRAQLRSTDSTWGLIELDEMAGWVADGIANPPRQRFMNRVIVTGLPLNFGRRIESGTRIYHPCKILLGPGAIPVNVRLFNDMRLWSSAARIVAGAVSPITLTGTLRVKVERESGARIVFIDAVDVYAATTEDMPSGVPGWMTEHIQSTNNRRKVDLGMLKSVPLDRSSVQTP